MKKVVENLSLKERFENYFGENEYVITCFYDNNEDEYYIDTHIVWMRTRGYITDRVYDESGKTIGVKVYINKKAKVRKSI